MDLKKCDICGTVGVEDKAFSYSIYYKGDIPEDEADLCPVCAREIVRYVKELRKRVCKR